MKILGVIISVFACVSFTAANADSLELVELKGCQKIAKVKEIFRTEKKLADFNEAEAAATSSIDAYKQSCDTYNADPSQANQLIRTTIPQQQADAVTKLDVAGKAFKAASEATSRTYAPVRKLRHSSCEEQLRSSFANVQAKWKKLEGKGRTLKSCIASAIKK